MPSEVFIRIDKTDKPYGTALMEAAFKVCFNWLNAVRSNYAINHRITGVNWNLVDLNYPMDEVNHRVDVAFVGEVAVIFDFMGHFMQGVDKYPEIVTRNAAGQDLFKAMYKKLVEDEQMPTFESAEEFKSFDDVAAAFGGEDELNPMLPYIKAFDVNGEKYMGIAAKFNG